MVSKVKILILKTNTYKRHEKFGAGKITKHFKKHLRQLAVQCGRLVQEMSHAKEQLRVTFTLDPITWGAIHKGTSINDVPCFLDVFDLPTSLVLLYNIQFWGLSWTPLPTLISDVINRRSYVVNPTTENICSIVECILCPMFCDEVVQ